MLSTQLIIQNYPVILSHQCSTTVSLETYPLSPKGRWLQRFHQHGIWPQQVDKEVIIIYLSGVRSIWTREKCFCLKSAFCVYMKSAFCTDHTLNFNFQPCSVLIDWLEPNQLPCWDLCTYYHYNAYNFHKVYTYILISIKNGLIFGSNLFKNSQEISCYTYRSQIFWRACTLRTNLS